jgi:hypothetical protein
MTWKEQTWGRPPSPGSAGVLAQCLDSPGQGPATEERSSTHASTAPRTHRLPRARQRPGVRAASAAAFARSTATLIAASTLPDPRAARGGPPRTARARERPRHPHLPRPKRQLTLPHSRTLRAVREPDSEGPGKPHPATAGPGPRASSPNALLPAPQAAGDGRDPRCFGLAEFAPPLWNLGSGDLKLPASPRPTG